MIALWIHIIGGAIGAFIGASISGVIMVRVVMRKHLKEIDEKAKRNWANTNEQNHKTRRH
jgi:hypothetical protein